MTAKQVARSQAPGEKIADADADQKAKQQRDSGMPGGGQGRVDVTGLIPENIHVDPDITEGHHLAGQTLEAVSHQA